MKKHAKLNFKQHVEYARKKASMGTMDLVSMMLNVVGTQHNCGLLVAKVVSSIVLYAFPDWGIALHALYNVNCVRSTEGQF